MNAEMLTYFAAERNGAALLLCMGAISFVGSYALWQSKSTFGAMIWPLLVLGALEIVIGAIVAYRTPAQVQDLQSGLARDNVATVSSELARMERVNRNFVIVKMIEGALIGGALLAVFILPLGSTGCAVGLGLLVQGAALLAFDAFAHHRAQTYVHWLERL